ncbi:MAG: PQQ-binding-like beta-propeller repeat protein, partial [Pirellulales bacterium]
MTRRFAGSSFCANSLAVCVVAAAMLATAPLHADDWPQWRGPDRTGLWQETGILREFPDSGLDVKWRVPVRSGYSGPAVADGRVFVLDYQETPGEVLRGAERLLALDEKTGQTLWSHEWPVDY